MTETRLLRFPFGMNLKEDARYRPAGPCGFCGQMADLIHDSDAAIRCAFCSWDVLNQRFSLNTDPGHIAAMERWKQEYGG